MVMPGQPRGAGADRPATACRFGHALTQGPAALTAARRGHLTLGKGRRHQQWGGVMHTLTGKNVTSKDIRHTGPGSPYNEKISCSVTSLL